MRTIEIPPGTELEKACEMAVRAVRNTPDYDPVSFTFNGVKVEVHEGMNVNEVAEKAWQGRIAKEGYEREKFEFDLRVTVARAMCDRLSCTNDADIDHVVSAIRPFLRTP